MQDPAIQKYLLIPNLQEMSWKIIISISAHSVESILSFIEGYRLFKAMMELSNANTFGALHS